MKTLRTLQPGFTGPHTLRAGTAALALALALGVGLTACDEPTAPHRQAGAGADARPITVRCLYALPSAFPSTVTVALSANPCGSDVFVNPQDWTQGPWWGTDYADVNGDGKADAIVVNSNGVVVRRSTGSSFAPNEDWTGGPYYASYSGLPGNFFADVNGDHRADAIVNDNPYFIN
jgi:hypothetical protein